MKRRIFIFALGILAVLLLPCHVKAEVKTLSWNPVTTYTDNSLIGGSALPVTYDAWWSTTNTFVSPHNLLSSGPTTSVEFNVSTQGMVRGTTIYFGARARTALNEVSVDSPPYSWLVPNLVLTSISIDSGPATVNENSTASYTAKATWSDNSVTTINPIWSVSPTTYANINSSGVLTTLLVYGADQQITITASYTADGITKTVTKTVTILNSTRPVAPTNLLIQ